MHLSSKTENFIAHCGEMGNRWGFNRTVGQMIGLLLISEQPLNAAEISETLSISRGNVSMGLKELQSWRLIQQHRVSGDRKEYYRPAGTIWDLANRVFEERRKREIDPTLSLLRDNLMEEPATNQEIYAQQRMQEMHDLLETITKWAAELQRLNPERLQSLMKLGSGITRVMDVTDKFLKTPKTDTPPE